MEPKRSREADFRLPHREIRKPQLSAATAIGAEQKECQLCLLELRELIHLQLRSATTSTQLRNGRWESTKFNERLQPTQIALGKTGPVVSGQQVTYSTELLKLEYQYGDPELQACKLAPVARRGNNLVLSLISLMS